MTGIYEYIGDQIRTLRKQKGINQDDLGKAIGVGSNTISRWETATYRLSIKDLQVIAQFFEVPMSAFLPDSPRPTEEASPVQQGGLPMLRKIRWHIRQLLPLTYRSHYEDGKGQKHFCVWNMWFGQCFNVEDVIV